MAKQRAQLERSFRTAIADMQQSQQERHARQSQPAQTAQPAKPAPPPVSKPAAPPAPRPEYTMAEGQEAHPIFCAPITPDTR